MAGWLGNAHLVFTLLRICERVYLCLWECTVWKSSTLISLRENEVRVGCRTLSSAFFYFFCLDNEVLAWSWQNKELWAEGAAEWSDSWQWVMSECHCLKTGQHLSLTVSPASDTDSPLLTHSDVEYSMSILWVFWLFRQVEPETLWRFSFL